MTFPSGVGEAITPENMEALYASIQLWAMEEEYDIPFSIWKGVDEYQEPLDPTSLSANFAAMFLEVASLLNTRVELTVILNDITKDNTMILGDKSNETVKFQRMERSIEEAVSIFQSVVDVEQQNGGPQEKRPLTENENPTIRSN